MKFEDFFGSVHSIYRISLKDIIHDKQLIKEDGSIDFVRVSNYSNEELEEMLLYTVSWLEIVNTKKAMLKSVFLKKKAEFDSEEAAKYLFYKESSDRRMTVKDIESLVESNQDLLEKKKKLIEYESYLEYLGQLQEIIELLHYAVKNIMHERSTAWKLSGQ